MLGLTPDQWDAIAAIAQVFGAIATFAAVIVALMLGRRQITEQLTVRTGTLHILSLRSGAERADEAEQVYATVTVTNGGMVPVHLGGIAWRESRRSPDVGITPAYGPSTDSVLEPGTSEEFGYSLDADGHLLNSTAADRMYPVGIIRPAFVRVSTQRGRHFIAPYPPAWRPVWLSRLRHLPASVRYQLRRFDSFGGFATTFPDRFPPAKAPLTDDKKGED